MNMKPLALTALMLGSLLLALGAYELNQYVTTSAALAPSMAMLDQLSSSESALTQLGIGTSELASTKQTLSNATGSLMQMALIDVFAGALFIVLGVAFYPKETR
ncbi:Uncharacterised protein [Candidatus Norongarragalina meridionalis]|nr:Uncharacterised protein [Candidatus Norongarragalina meridionalis]